MGKSLAMEYATAKTEEYAIFFDLPVVPSIPVIKFVRLKLLAQRRTLHSHVGVRCGSEEGGGAQAVAGVSDNRASGGDREAEGGSQLRRYHPEGRNVQVCQRAG